MLQLSSFQFSLNHILRTQQNISVILSQYDTNASKSSSRVFFPLKPSVSTFPLAFSCPVFPPACPIELCFQDSRSSLAHSLKLSHVFQLVSELYFQGLIAAQAQRLHINFSILIFSPHYAQACALVSFLELGETTLTPGA